jgi:IS5 family transposase
MNALGCNDGSNPLSQKEPEPPVFQAYGPGPSLWEPVLPGQLLALPEALARADKLLDDPAFFEPFRRYFDPRVGRKSVPMGTFLRRAYLKYRHRIG